MVEGLLWIVSIYALCAGFIHIYVRFNNRVVEEKIVYLTGTSFYPVECVLRFWLFMSSFKGTALHVIVLNADEETEAIVERLSRRLPVRSLRSHELSKQERDKLEATMAASTVIDVKRIEKSKRFPTI